MGSRKSWTRAWDLERWHKECWAWPGFKNFFHMTSFVKLFTHDQFCKTCLMDQWWEQFFQESPACDFQVGPGSRESARDRSNCDRQHCLWQQILPRSYSQQVGVGSCFLSPLLVTGTWWCLTWWGRWRPTTWREGGELGAVKAAAPSAWNILHKSQKICLNPSRGRVKSLPSIFLWPTWGSSLWEGRLWCGHSQNTTV